MSSTTTPSGASERRHCQCLCSPLRPRSRAGVFRRREGPASQSPPGTPPSFSRACPLVMYEAFPRPVDSLPPTRLWYGSASPSSLPTSSLLQSSKRGGYVFQGVRTCFPGAIDTEFGHRNSFVFLTESLIHGDPVNRGVRTSFPGRDRVPVRPLCFPRPAQLRCARALFQSGLSLRYCVCGLSFGPLCA